MLELYFKISVKKLHTTNLIIYRNIDNLRAHFLCTAILYKTFYAMLTACVLYEQIPMFGI